jgi:hypothetical protein
MKVLIAVISFILVTGCTHLSVSNTELLAPIENKGKISTDDLVVYPLEVEASMDCYTKRVNSQTSRKTCSNKYRINNIVESFNENGLKPIPAEKDQGSAKISVIIEPISGFFEKFTGVFNIITLGLVPLYHYDDYIVTFEDPKNGVFIEKQARVSSYHSWFSLFMSNPEGLKEQDIKSRTESNLLDSVVKEVSVASKK